MKILSIDSASKVATVAILDDNNLIAEYTLNNKLEHSTLIMDIVDKLLTDSDLDIDDIDGFVVSKGPGSFTGLRIGMATIKGLSLGSNKPYISISSLDALAHSLVNFDGIICSMMDALRNSVYTCLYKGENGNLESLIDYSALEIEELVALLKEKNEKVIFTGDAVNKHKEYIMENLPTAIFAPIHLNIIRASSLGELGMKKTFKWWERWFKFITFLFKETSSSKRIRKEVGFKKWR